MKGRSLRRPADLTGSGSGLRASGIDGAVIGGRNEKTGGTYAGLRYTFAWHSGTGLVAPIILTGWIEELDD